MKKDDKKSFILNLCGYLKIFVILTYDINLILIKYLNVKSTRQAVCDDFCQNKKSLSTLSRRAVHVIISISYPT